MEVLLWSNQHFADQGINLAFRFEELEVGESVSFAFDNALNEGSLMEAMKSITALAIEQPVDTVGGSNALFSCRLAEDSTAVMSFYVTRGGAETPVGTSSAKSGGSYEVTFDSRVFTSILTMSSSAQLLLVQKYETSKVVAIYNDDTDFEFVLPVKPSDGSDFQFTKGVTTTVKISGSASPLSNSSETMTAAGIESKVVATVTSAPWQRM